MKNVHYKKNSFAAALNTRNVHVICRTLKSLQQLAKSADYIGQALVPYYRQLLPVFNMFKHNNRKYWPQYVYEHQLPLSNLYIQCPKCSDNRSSHDDNRLIRLQ